MLIDLTCNFNSFLSCTDTGPPDIVDGPETMVDGDTTFYNVGNDICILSNMPTKIALLCGHDNNDTIKSIPTATWTVSARGVTISHPAITFSDYPFRLGTNDQLLIDNKKNYPLIEMVWDKNKVINIKIKQVRITQFFKFMYKIL